MYSSTVGERFPTYNLSGLPVIVEVEEEDEGARERELELSGILPED